MMNYKLVVLIQCSDYQPPEYIDKGEISKKFDIFSLGVIMIMIVSGPDSIYEDMSNEKIIDIVRTRTSL